MTRMLRPLSQSLLMLAASLFLCNASQAQTYDRTVKFCNHTRDVLKVAAGYDKSGTSESTSAGWYTVQSCQCRNVISASLRATEVFLFAARSGTIAPRLEGRGPLCIHPTRAFNLVSQNRNAAACAAWGGKWVNFKYYDTGGSRNYTVTLKTPNTCNL